MAFAILTAIAGPASAQEMTAVIINPDTGYVGAVMVIGDGEVGPEHVSRCGAGCELLDVVLPGSCAVVSLSPDGSYGYQVGSADEVGYLQRKARLTCQEYGGTQCRETTPICGQCADHLRVGPWIDAVLALAAISVEIAVTELYSRKGFVG